MTTILSVLFALSVFCAAAPGQRRGTPKSTNYRDTELEISLQLPGLWSRVPRHNTEYWIAAKFLEEFDPDWERALLRVIVIPQDLEKARNLITTRAGDPFVIHTGSKGRVDYRTFIKIRTNGTVRDLGKGDAPAGRYKDYLAHDKLNYQWQRFARSFERDGYRVIVELSCAEKRWSKQAALWKTLCASIAHEKYAPRSVRTSNPMMKFSLGGADLVDWRALPLRDRRNLRKKFDENYLACLERNTVAPWKTFELNRYVVVARFKKKTALGLAKRLDPFSSFLEKQFGRVSDEHARRFVVRMCSGSLEEGIYGGAIGWGFEEATYHHFEPLSEAHSTQFASTYVSMFRNFIDDKDPILRQFLPIWIRDGFGEAIHSCARIKQGRIVFRKNEFDDEFGRAELEKGKLLPFSKLARMTGSEFGKWGATVERTDVECRLAICFVLQQKQRIKELKGFLPRYFAALSKAGKPLAELESFYSELAGIQRRVLDEVVGTDERVWRRIDKAFQEFVR